MDNTSKKRIVVKIGTSSLTHKNGKISLYSMDRAIRQLSDLKNEGYDIVLVTSGAVGAGLTRLNLNQRPTTTAEKQAVAAVGQGILMHMYEKLFSEYGIIVAQVLLTRDDLSIRKKCVNFINSIDNIFKYGVIPIINENDTVATEELNFSDNDTLSAMVASLIEADLLIILSDIDGLYDKDPHRYKDAKIIHTVKDINENIKKLAGDSFESMGTGGMKTKIKAAEIAVHSGVGMFIANGGEDMVLQKLLRGERIGTYFEPLTKKINRRGRWIAFSSLTEGVIYIDKGAEDALVKRGKSLLSCGIKSISGEFEIGDTVSISNMNNDIIGKGIVNFSSEDLMRIKGLNSSKIEDVLGHKLYDEVIHRDNLVVL